MAIQQPVGSGSGPGSMKLQKESLLKVSISGKETQRVDLGLMTKLQTISVR